MIPLIRSKKILAHAKGQNCTLRLDVCNNNPETVVFCHLNMKAAGKGTGIKASDHLGFFGCFECHRAYDSQSGRSDLAADVLRAVCETWGILIRDGIIIVPQDAPKLPQKITRKPKGQRKAIPARPFSDRADYYGTCWKYTPARDIHEDSE